MLADVDVRNPMGEIVGNVDVIMCGNCMEQSARMVGSATKAETDELVQEIVDLKNQERTLKDEISSWTQRYYTLIDKLSEEEKVKASA